MKGKSCAGLTIFVLSILLICQEGESSALPHPWHGGISFSDRGFSEASGLVPSEMYSFGMFLDPLQWTTFNPHFAIGFLIPLFPPSLDETLVRGSIWITIHHFRRHPFHCLSYMETSFAPAFLIERLFRIRRSQCIYSFVFLPFRIKTADGYTSFLGIGLVLDQLGRYIGYQVMLFEISQYLF
ncbi:MAG: hypothetical protein GH155_06205 [Spirochaeta sp.]|nr:hypothetical protein [Spirochaeta sp.]